MRRAVMACLVLGVLVGWVLPGLADDSFICSGKAVRSCTVRFLKKTIAAGCDLEKTCFDGPEGPRRLKECVERAKEALRAESVPGQREGTSCGDIAHFPVTCELYFAAVTRFLAAHAKHEDDWACIDPLLAELVERGDAWLDQFVADARRLPGGGGDELAERILAIQARRMTVVFSHLPPGTMVFDGDGRQALIAKGPEETLDVEAGDRLVLEHPCYQGRDGSPRVVFEVPPGTEGDREVRVDGQSLFAPRVTLRVDVASPDVHPEKIRFDRSPWMDAAPFLGKEGPVCYEGLASDLEDGRLAVRFQGEGPLSWQSLVLTVAGVPGQRLQLPPGGIAVLVLEEDLRGAERLLVRDLEKRWSWTGLPVSGVGVVGSLEEARRRLATGDYVLGLVGRRGTGSEDVYWQALHPVLAESWLGERVRTVPALDGASLQGVDALDSLLRIDLPRLVSPELPLGMVEVPWRSHPVVVRVLDRALDGVDAGDEVVAIDAGETRTVSTLRELRKALQAVDGDSVTLTLRRGTREWKVAVPVVRGPLLLEELPALPGEGLSGILFSLELLSRTSADPAIRYAARYNAFTILVGGAQSSRAPLAPMRRLRARLNAEGEEGCRAQVPGCNAIAFYQNLRATLVGETELDLGKGDWLNRPFGDSVAEHEILVGHELPAGGGEAR